MDTNPRPLLDTPPAVHAIAALRRLGREEEAERLHAVLLASDPERSARVHDLSVEYFRRQSLAETPAPVTPPDPNAMAATDAYLNLGLALKALKRLDDARVAFEKALIIRPDTAAHGLLADLLSLLRQYEPATAHYHQALDRLPAGNERQRGGLHKGLGLALQAQGLEEEAAAQFRRALELCPDMVEVHNDLGNALQGLGRHSEAIEHYRILLRAKPGYAKAYYNVGNAVRALNNLPLALKCYQQAIQLEPRYMKAHNNCGTTLNALGRPEEALYHYEQVLEVDPGFVGAYINKGNALQALDRPTDSIASYRQALAHDANNADAYSNIGHAYHALNRFDDALAAYAQARAINPDHPDAHWNEALTRLAMGDYRRGWQLYEWRWRNPTLGIKQRALQGTLWLGREDIHDRTILIHAEQGLGDALQFARYLPLVAATGARVLLEVHPPLVALMAGIPGVERLLMRGDTLPPYDYHCPMMSLPQAFDSTVDTLPWSGPYITAPADRLEKWRDVLAPSLSGPTGTDHAGRRRPRVGIAWAGNPAHKNDRNRSAPLAPLAAMLTEQGAAVVAVQKGLRPGDAERLAALPDTLVLDEKLEDFADTAAVVAQLDLVIAVDTSVAHLAGAMGKPLWVMLPHNADWRWMAGREDSPWYPSARLFRQTAPGDWAGVMTAMAAALPDLPLE